MAKNKKYRKAKGKDLLLPYVPDAPGAAAGEQTSETKRRADRTVDQLIESLFGEKSKRGSAAVMLRERESVPSEAVHSEPIEDVTELVAEVPEHKAQIEVLDFEPLPATELSFKEEIEASAADFRLLLDMEYEQELGDAIGFERIRAYHEKHMNGHKSSRRRASRENEFESQAQDAEVRRRYARERKRAIVRLAISAFLLLLMLLYENTALMTRLFNGPLDGARYPMPYVLIGLQLLLLDAWVCYRPLREGFARILRFSPADHSAHAAIVLVSAVYHVVILFLPIRHYPVLFLSPAALSITLLAASELLNVCREGLAFDVVSARRQKYAILPRICVGGEQSSARARLEKSGEDGTVWYLRPVGFVRNYFANTKAQGVGHANLGAHFLLIAAIGTVLALFFYAGGAIPSQATAMLMVVMLLCAPAISSLLTALPMFFCAAFCLRGRGAIIGEAPLEQCRGNDTLTLPDTDLFAAIQHDHFHLLDLCDAHRVTVLVRALLEKVQSPLATTFGVDPASRISTADLAITHIDACGVLAELHGGESRVAIGTAKYMQQRGFVLPIGEEARAVDVRRLLVAVDGRVCASFSVRYTPAADLQALFLALMRDGVRVTVRSKDPALREEVFAELFPQLPGKVLVQKPSVDELELRTDRVDSGVVSLGSCKELARTYMFCRRVRRAGLLGKIIQVLCVLCGGALAAFLTLRAQLLSAAWITLWMFLWCGIYAVTCYFYLRRPTDDI